MITEISLNTGNANNAEVTHFTCSDITIIVGPDNAGKSLLLEGRLSGRRRASYGQLGRQEESQAALARYRALRPGKSVLEHAATEPFKNAADLNHLLDGLRKAGLLE